MRGFAILVVAFAIGGAWASFFPAGPQYLRKLVGAAAPDTASIQAPGAEKKKPAAEAPDAPQYVKLTDEQITNARMDLAEAQGGTLIHRLLVPGTVVPHGDRIARVSVKLSGTVAELRKKLGDAVAKDEVMAILESREVADAKSEYLAAKLTTELQQDLFQRDKALWDKQIAPEQQYLRSRNVAAQARMRFDISRQKLLALGLMEREIASLPDEPEALLRRQEVRAPMAGRVVERKVDLGTAVGRDNLETELFLIIDLDKVWIDLAVSPADLSAIKEGQTVTITTRGAKESTDGKVVFISPLLDKDTRAARVVAEITNTEGVWRPGSFVSAAIAIDQQPVGLAVPTSAVQTIGGDKVVFVRVPDGFEKRPVTLGRNDARMTEIVAGLQSGETVAVNNTFALKAEFMKGAAED